MASGLFSIYLIYADGNGCHGLHRSPSMQIMRYHSLAFEILFAWYCVSIQSLCESLSWLDQEYQSGYTFRGQQVCHQTYYVVVALHLHCAPGDPYVNYLQLGIQVNILQSNPDCLGQSQPTGCKIPQGNRALFNNMKSYGKY